MLNNKSFTIPLVFFVLLFMLLFHTPHVLALDSDSPICRFMINKFGKNLSVCFGKKDEIKAGPLISEGPETGIPADIDAAVKKSRTCEIAVNYVKIAINNLSLDDESRRIYNYVTQVTNVPWQLLAAVHYRETGNLNVSPRGSFVSGTPIGEDEYVSITRFAVPGTCGLADNSPQANKLLVKVPPGPGNPGEFGCGFKSLEDSALYAAYTLIKKAGGTIPNSYGEKALAFARYYGFMAPNGINSDGRMDLNTACYRDEQGNIRPKNQSLSWSPKCNSSELSNNPGIDPILNSSHYVFNCIDEFHADMNVLACDGGMCNEDVIDKNLGTMTVLKLIEDQFFTDPLAIREEFIERKTQVLLQELETIPKKDAKNIQYMLSLMQECGERIDRSNLSCIKTSSLPSYALRVIETETQALAQFQCVAWAKTSRSFQLGLQESRAWGNAAQTLSNKAGGMTPFYTKDPKQLQPGDYVVWPIIPAIRPVGHIAYVVAISENKKYFYTTEANFYGNGEIGLVRHIANDETILGYLRP